MLTAVIAVGELLRGGQHGGRVRCGRWWPRRSGPVRRTAVGRRRRRTSSRPAAGSAGRGGRGWRRGQGRQAAGGLSCGDRGEEIAGDLAELAPDRVGSSGVRMPSLVTAVVRFVTSCVSFVQAAGGVSCTGGRRRRRQHGDNRRRPAPRVGRRVERGTCKSSSPDRNSVAEELRSDGKHGRRVCSRVRMPNSLDGELVGSTCRDIGVMCARTRWFRDTFGVPTAVGPRSPAGRGGLVPSCHGQRADDRGLAGRAGGGRRRRVPMVVCWARTGGRIDVFELASVTKLLTAYADVDRGRGGRGRVGPAGGAARVHVAASGVARVRPGVQRAQGDGSAGRAAAVLERGVRGVGVCC